MEYKDIKDKLPKATQYIAVKFSYRPGRETPIDRLIRSAWFWLSEIQDGRITPNTDGRYPGSWWMTLAKGEKENCLGVVAEHRFWDREHGSLSRGVQLGMWREAYRVLPADDQGRWVPSTGIIKKALEQLNNLK